MRLLPLLLLCACASQNDRDRDGFGVLDGDCDDHDPTIHPAAPELCNDVDDDCDGEVDDDAAGGEWYYVDADADGYGMTAYAIQHCGPLEGWALERGDCDDGDPTVHVGAEEVCNGVDDDCDGRIDDHAADAITWYRDLDGDGYGDSATGWPGCQQPSGRTDVDGDCDDEDPEINPGVSERCWTDADDDCSGTNNDMDAAGCEERYQDADGDGFAGSGACLCEPEEPYLFDLSEDCDDDDPTVYPGAVERADFVDDDCDGEAPASVEQLGVRLLGEDPIDRAGHRVAALGDLNGDGFADLGVGAYGDDRGGSDAGAAYVVLGPVDADRDLAEADAVLVGVSAGDQASTGLDGAGDLNGDGYDDIVLGAHHAQGQAGAAYVVLGPVEDQLGLGSADAVWSGSTSGDWAGYAVGGGHDTDGDGLSDVIVGAWGRDFGREDSGVAYLLLGPATGGGLLESADAVLQSADLDGAFGRAVEIAADHDGDGLGEVIVGCPEDDGDFNDSGALYLYRGPVRYGVIQDARVFGEYAQDGFGWDLAGDADLDADGLADLAVGAYDADYLREDAGAVYVFSNLGNGEYSATDILVARIVGPASGDRLYQVESAGDVDGDGFDDLLVGARYHDGAAEDAGRAWLLFGPVEGNLDLARGGGVAIDGEGPGDQLGCSLAGPGDVDGDGVPDLFIGARDASITDGAGAAYLIPGGRP